MLKDTLSGKCHTCGGHTDEKNEGDEAALKGSENDMEDDKEGRRCDSSSGLKCSSRLFSVSSSSSSFKSPSSSPSSSSSSSSLSPSPSPSPSTSSTSSSSCSLSRRETSRKSETTESSSTQSSLSSNLPSSSSCSSVSSSPSSFLFLPKAVFTTSSWTAFLWSSSRCSDKCRKDNCKSNFWLSLCKRISSTFSSIHRRNLCSPLLVLTILVSTVLRIAEACSSRSTPKPRPPSPTTRPNITFQTCACPEAYAKWYCLNGATCFSVRIGESILYNCECADGFMGQRCEFKDLDGSYLPSREKVMIETAGVSAGFMVAVLLVAFIIIIFYTYLSVNNKSDSVRIRNFV